MYKIKGLAFYEKKIMIVEKMPNDKGIHKCYTDEGYSGITTEQKKEYSFKISESEYLLIEKEKEYKGTMKQYYNEFVQHADELKKITNGRINMYKTGRYSKTALKLLFDTMQNKNIELDPIQKYETRFLADCGAGFRIAVPYEGPLYKYDINSFYAHIYSSEHLMIPIKQGILKTLSQEEFDKMSFCPIGVYKCDIETPTGNLKKLIWINPNKYYTHYELNYIREKGLKIKMIVEPDNCIMYPRKTHCMTGSEVFGEFTDIVWPIKRDKLCNGAKHLLTHVWGIVIKRNKEVIYFDDRMNQEPPRDDIPDFVDAILTENKEMIFRYTYYTGSGFEYDLARMKPFFLAKCRLYMSKTIEPFVDDVVFSHTDSIVSKVPIDKYIKISKKLGDFKYEGYCEDGFVKNMGSKSANDDFII